MEVPRFVLAQIAMSNTSAMNVSAEADALSELDRIRAVIDLCVEAQLNLDREASFRCHVLLEMVLLELRRFDARRTDPSRR